MSQLQSVIRKIIEDVAELPDRDSPSDWPDAMLVTAEELQMILEEHLATPQTGVRGLSEGLAGEPVAFKQLQALTNPYGHCQVSAHAWDMAIAEAMRVVRAAPQPATKGEQEPAIIGMANALKNIDNIMQAMFEGGFGESGNRKAHRDILSLAQTWIQYADVIKGEAA